MKNVRLLMERISELQAFQGYPKVVVPESVPVLMGGEVTDSDAYPLLESKSLPPKVLPPLHVVSLPGPTNGSRCSY